MMFQTIKNPPGGIGGPKPSDFRSQTSDMCGGLRWNFDKNSFLARANGRKMA